MDDDDPPKRKRWKSRSSKGRASAGLGFLASPGEWRDFRSTQAAAVASVAKRDPWDVPITADQRRKRTQDQ